LEVLRRRAIRDELARANDSPFDATYSELDVFDAQLSVARFPLDALPSTDRSHVVTGLTVVSIDANKFTRYAGQVIEYIDFPIDAVLSIERRFRMATFSFAQMIRRSVLRGTVQRAEPGACNLKHLVNKRFAQRLSMTDDLFGGAKFKLTHETLATMLDVRRADISIAAAELQRLGAISYRHWVIAVLDKALLNTMVRAYAYRDALNATTAAHVSERAQPSRHRIQGFVVELNGSSNVCLGVRRSGDPLRRRFRLLGRIWCGMV
jgi:hypothetical protein